ncbi:MAG: DUF1801 domain-containing protein [Bacteroidales bacterium]|nr:DUF1801 domain-containing protein [Bacteroidales bacterium]
MKKLIIDTRQGIKEVFDKYPPHIKPKIENLRRLILEAAGELKHVAEVEETLKWGEPSYLTKTGSTVRIDWKDKKPDQYAIYFKCTSKLVSTFRMVYNKTFRYEGDRAIIFKLDDEIPEAALKACIKAALNYHKVKNVPLLGM